jgi:hypothetical protein
MRLISAGLGLLVMAGVAAAQDGAVGKILSASKLPGNTSEIELSVIKGYFFKDSAVDLFDSVDPKTRGEGTLALPASIEMLMTGDKVKVRLTTKGPFSPATAIVAEKGKFPNQAAVMQVVNSTGGPPAGASAAPVQAPAAPKRALPPACPFTAAELKTALGLEVEAGKAAPAMPFSGGTSLGCDYYGKTVTAPSVRVNQIVMDDPAQADPKSYATMLAGKMEPVPNDPDRAMWQGNQGDLTNATLQYARAGVLVEVRVGVRPSDPSFQPMKQLLTRLRRLP